MKVTVEGVPQVPVGNNGILLRIRNEEGANIGKLWIGQARIRWAPGSVPEHNARTLTMTRFVEFLNTLT